MYFEGTERNFIIFLFFPSLTLDGEGNHQTQNANTAHLSNQEDLGEEEKKNNNNNLPKTILTAKTESIFNLE